ncbi:Uma2 family endonuclease [Streptomyces sp. YU58]|uniref:Uma2 family endonuclease n=1 Tax=Streptomyces sp. SX92 TaxID=3158972 RepID=UPI0027B902E0|nr:Uma2 family endonuclease [Streptomyces coralus]WLW52664.1 Uma2 family endonuclease [Streptomyces coralus]
MDTFDGDYVMTDDVWEELVWVWGRTDAPKGCKVEIVDGIVIVTPLSAISHHVIAETLTRHVYGVIPRDRGVYQRLALAVPTRLGLYMPDLAVVREEELRTSGDTLVPAGSAELVVEITSKATAHNDRVLKAVGYAAAGVPLYLLIDGWAPGGPVITLYGEPHGCAYRILSACAFGDPMALPQPFGLTLDTGGFPAP